MDAGSLQCPTCGAAALADAASCAYCKARLATVACPSCFGMVFAGTHFCPHCGSAGARAAAADGGDAERRCPRCRAAMERLAVGEAPVHECGRCGGLWLDAATFDRVATERESQVSVLASLGGAAQPLPAASPDPVRYGPCPECGRVMNRVNFARISGVVVDVCRGHGTWFDADELRRVVEFIRSGGLDRARAKERLMLGDERRRLAGAQGTPGGAGMGFAGDAGFRTDRSSAGLLRDLAVDGLALTLWSALRDAFRG